MKPRACQKLEDKVIRTGLCTLCGACVGTCPYIVAHEGRVLVRDACDLTEGHCVVACPRISLNLDALSRQVMQTPYRWEDIGETLTVLMARSADPNVAARAQDAGTVTALMRFALEEGIVDSAVVTSFEDKSYPRARAVSDAVEVLRCCGSSYMAAPTIEAFNAVYRQPHPEKVGVVATPCQALSLAKMKAFGAHGPNGMSRLGLVIGLFCTWALSYPAFSEFLKNRVPEPVVKYRIPPPPAGLLQAFTADGRVDLPLDEVMPFVRPACRLCHDMTSEFADLSVGAVEFPEGPSGGVRSGTRSWNTMIVRTPRGMDFVTRARDRGVIETGDLPAESLSHLREASLNKKRRALQNIIQRTGSREDLMYLNVDASVIERLLAK